LPRIREAGQVAEFGDDRDGDEELDAAQRLQGLDDGIQAPGGRTLEQFDLKPLEPIDLFIDGADLFLKDDLLRWRRADDHGEVSPVGVGPVGPADIVPPESQQEGLQAELRILEGEPRGVARPTEVADRFVVDGRHVDGREIPIAEQPRELDRVTPVGLDLVARFLRNQRRGDDLTREALAGQIPLQDVPARTRFVREHQVGCLGLQAPDQLVEVRLARPGRPDEHRRGRVPAVRVCDRDGILVNVETDEKRCRLCHS